MRVADLFNEAAFPPADHRLWREMAEKALGGSSFEEKLVSRTDDGLRVEPLHTRSSGARALLRARPHPSWAIVQRADDPDLVRAAAQIREDVENGANGVALVFEGAPNAFGYGLPCSPEALAAMLDAVPLNETYLRVDVHPASRAMADWLVAAIGQRRVDPARLDVSFGIDPAATFAGTGRLRMSIEALQASLPQSLAHFFGLGLPGILLEADGRVLHNAGATEAQELGMMLAVGVAHLRLFEEARQSLAHAVPHIGFALAVDQDQLVSMAKIRALRQMWARVQAICGLEPSAVRVHAETSYRMLTEADPETDVLRATIACFAAATAGADSVSVLPHSLSRGLPGPAARRLARNTQVILAEESHLGFVLDPVAGAGGVETLTDDLCEAAWAEFRQIESEGGALRSLAAGHPQARVKAATEQRRKAFAEGRRAIVGTTVFPPNLRPVVEVLAAETRPLPVDGTVRCQPLPALRFDQLVEARP